MGHPVFNSGAILERIFTVVCNVLLRIFKAHIFFSFHHWDELATIENGKKKPMAKFGSKGLKIIATASFKTSFFVQSAELCIE